MRGQISAARTTMVDFPTANFSGTDDGLFTIEEIRRLMEAEFDRALRYQYPLVFMTIGVDRIDHLQDLYGFESKAVILRSVTDLLQSVSRASDFLGCLVDDRVLALFPYTDPEGAAAVARRLLAGARSLKFDGQGHTLQVTLSIGASHNQTLAPHSYEDLVRTGEEALSVARAGGGDRYVVREAALLAPDPSVLRRAPEPPPAAPFPPSSQAVDEVALFDRIREYLVLQGDLPGQGRNGDLEKEIVASVLKALRQDREAIESGNASTRGQIELLERRIAKLSSTLSSTESALQSIARQKHGAADEGVPSIYREVQGLDEADAEAEVKKEMMEQIFRANLELRVRSES